MNKAANPTRPMYSSKNLLVSCSLGYTPEKIVNWAKTASIKIKDADIVILTDRDLQEFQDNCFARITFKNINHHDISSLNIHQELFKLRTKKVAPHVARFIHISKFLKSIHHDYVITTDIRDVVFQSDPFIGLSKYIGNRSLLVSGEGISYNNESWGKRNLLQCFGEEIAAQYWDYESLNVGVLAGTKKIVSSLCEQIAVLSLGRPIPIVDQAIFHFLVRGEAYTQVSTILSMDTAWACHLGTTNDPRIINQYHNKLLINPPILRDGMICTHDGQPFSIVHQYDRCDQLQDQMLVLS